jgi:two-component system, OmpR family, sensor histidine kinase BaeS
MILVNIAWFTVIISGYFFWTRKVFRPIDTLIERVDTISQGDNFSNIHYQRKDEFYPLIGAINNLNKSLSIQQKIRSNFLSDLSHEIRTPITAVKLYLEGIEDGIIQLDQKIIKLLTKELSRLTDITEKIMKYEHLSSDTFDTIHVSRFGIKKLLEELIEEYHIQLTEKNQTIQHALESEFLIHMDKNMCIQILHNIFSNFLKYA